MLESQIKDELIGVIHLIDEIYKPFGFNYKVNFLPSRKRQWAQMNFGKKATSGLMQALEEVGMPYTLNPEIESILKIDYHLEDSLVELGNVVPFNFTFQMPEKFDMTYIGEDGENIVLSWCTVPS